MIPTCHQDDDNRCTVHGGLWDHNLAGCQTTEVLREVRDERAHQFSRYGSNSDLEDGTGPEEPWLGQELDSNGLLPARHIEQCFRQDYTDHEGATGLPTWMHLVREEVAEAFMENDLQHLRQELLQVAALAVSWIEKLDAR